MLTTVCLSPLCHVGFSPLSLESIYFYLKEILRSKLCKSRGSLLRMEVRNCPLRNVGKCRNRLFCFVGVTYYGESLSVSYCGKFVLVDGATQ